MLGKRFSICLWLSVSRNMTDKNNPDETVLSKVFARENISCKIPIELPYYSCNTFKQVCIQCGKASKLIVDPQHYPQCERCKRIEKIKIIKCKKTIESDLFANKEVKNYYSYSFLLQYFVWD